MAVAVVVVQYEATDGSDGSSNESEITDLFEDAILSPEPADCARLFTQGYLEQAAGYGGAAAVMACEKRAQDDVGRPDDIDVSAIDVNGDEAIAHVAFSGGALDGSIVIYRLVPLGATWRLDHVDGFDQFNRDAYLDAYTEELQTADLALSEEAAECTTDGLSELSDDELTELFLEADLVSAAKYVIACDRGALETRMVGRFEDSGLDVPDSVGSCVAARLKRVSDSQLAALAGTPSGGLRPFVDCDRDAVLGAYRAAFATGSDATYEERNCVIRQLARLTDTEFTDALAQTNDDLREIAGGCAG